LLEQSQTAEAKKFWTEKMPFSGKLNGIMGQPGGSAA